MGWVQVVPIFIDQFRDLGRRYFAKLTERRAEQAATGPTFQSFWWGGSLSPYERLCLKSFLDMGHSVNLYTFEFDIEVPRGVTVCDAGEIVPRDHFFLNQSGYGEGLPNAFSNLFRYKLLAERGGWWIDTDVVCLSRHIPVVEQFVARHNGDRINNAVMFFKPNHLLIISCLEQSLAIGRSAKFTETGPQLITSLAEKFDLAIFPESVCYPVHFSEVADLLQPACTQALRSRTRNSIFLHLYNSALRQDGVNKYLLPPNGSLLRELVERHGVEGWSGEYDEQNAPKNDPMFAEAGRNAEAARRARDRKCAP